MNQQAQGRRKEREGERRGEKEEGEEECANMSMNASKEQIECSRQKEWVKRS